MTETFPSTFDIGDRVRLIGKFTNLAGTATDPTSVTCKVRDPSGKITSYSDAVKDVVGTWYKEIDIEEAGKWTFRFEGTGAVKAAEEMFFKVERSLF